LADGQDLKGNPTKHDLSTGEGKRTGRIETATHEARRREETGGTNKRKKRLKLIGEKNGTGMRLLPRRFTEGKRKKTFLEGKGPGGKIA